MTGDRDEVDEYLNELCWATGGSLAEQQAIRDELRAHIRDEARELAMQGVANGEARRRVLRGLGDATEVGRAMRASRRTAATRRPLVQPEGALVLGRRRERSLPPPGVLFALLASLVASAVVAIAYAWPA